MTNHVHLLGTSAMRDGFSKMMQAVGRHYLRYFNHSYRRTGTLWEGRFKSCVVDTENCRSFYSDPKHLVSKLLSLGITTDITLVGNESVILFLN